jgi:hypothetical protein
MYVRLKSAVHITIEVVRGRLAALVARLRRLWVTHMRLLHENTSYAAAAAAGAAAVVGQDNVLDLLATLAATALAIYASTRRAITFH